MVQELVSSVAEADEQIKTAEDTAVFQLERSCMYGTHNSHHLGLVRITTLKKALSRRFSGIPYSLPSIPELTRCELSPCVEG